MSLNENPCSLVAVAVRELRQDGQLGSWIREGTENNTISTDNTAERCACKCARQFARFPSVKHEHVSAANYSPLMALCINNVADSRTVLVESPALPLQKPGLQ